MEREGQKTYKCILVNALAFLERVNCNGIIIILVIIAITLKTSRILVDVWNSTKSHMCPIHRLSIPATTKCADLKCFV